MCYGMESWIIKTLVMQMKAVAKEKHISKYLKYMHVMNDDWLS